MDGGRSPSEFMLDWNYIHFSCSQLQNERVRWFTDNQNVVKIVSNGSKKPFLQQEALRIHTKWIGLQIGATTKLHG